MKLGEPIQRVEVDIKCGRTDFSHSGSVFSEICRYATAGNVVKRIFPSAMFRSESGYLIKASIFIWTFLPILELSIDIDNNPALFQLSGVGTLNKAMEERRDNPSSLSIYFHKVISGDVYILWSDENGFYYDKRGAE